MSTTSTTRSRRAPGLCNVDAVKVLVEEGPENIRTLIDMQIPFDVNSEGDLQITREGRAS